VNGFLGKLGVIADTGAQRSVAGRGLVERLGLRDLDVKRCDSRLESVNGKQIDICGYVDFKLELGNSTHSEEVVLCRDISDSDIYLSLEACRSLGIVHKSFPLQVGNGDSMTQGSIRAAEPVRDVFLREFTKVFDPGEGLPVMSGDPMKIELLPDARPYCMSGVRPVPYAIREETRLEIKRMEEQGIIEPMGDDPCEWCHPMVVISKPRGGVRITVDLTHLNSQVKRPIHHAKTPFDAVSEIVEGARFFTVCDAVKGYWQVDLEPESRQFTTFYTPWGRFRFKRAPMGFISTGDSYNWRGDKAIEGLDRTHKIVDDVLIASRTYDEHIRDVRNFLEVCKSNNITLSKVKLQLAKSEVKFAGFLVNSEGFQGDPDKVKAISSFPRPENITQMRSFMGLVNQLGSFSSEISSVAYPLRGLLKKKNEFVWLDSHQKAFDSVKKCLSQPPVLANFDPKKDTRLETDASRLNGLGFMLLQNHNGQWKLILCGSRFLADVETRYSMIELEALAIKYAVRKCHLYLYGLRTFDVITDHRPLLPIFNSYHLSQVENAKIQGIKAGLQSQYQFVLKWRAGKDHVLADCLSRAPVDDPGEDDEVLGAPMATVIGCVYDELHQAQIDLKIEELRLIAKDDSEYQSLIKEILRDFQKLKNAKPFVKQFQAMAHELSVDKGLVFYGDRILIPYAKRKEVLSSLHAAHQGITRTKQRARLSVYWPGINHEITQMIEKCEACQSHLGSQIKETRMENVVPTRPFECMSADLFSLNGHSFLICADRYSGYVYVKEFRRDPNAKQVISAFLEMWQHSGYPVQLRTDNGPQFNSNIFRKFCEKKGVRWNPSTPHFPSSNGHAEVNVKKVKGMISKLGCDTEDEKFTDAILELHNTPNENGFSPNQIVFGCNVRSMVPYLANFTKKWRDMAEEIDSKKAKLTQKAEKYYNRSARDLRPLKIGIKVRIQNMVTKRWDRVGEIVAIGKNRDYNIKMPSGRIWWRNRKFLRMFHEPLRSNATESVVEPSKPRRSERIKKLFKK